MLFLRGFLRVIRFYNAEQAGKLLEVSQDHVRHLIRQGRLRAKKVGGPKGDYLIHPVDVKRLHVVRELAAAKQDPLRPDIIWVMESCGLLVEKIQAENFQPELVIGVAFGGLLPASFVSTTLRVPFQFLRVIHYDGTTRLPEVTIAHNADRFGNVQTLVVDDVTDSGDTLTATQSYLLAHGVGVENLRFATLHKKQGTKFEPNWYVDIVDGWIYYPWEIQDS